MLAGIYIGISAYLLATQGIFGESFVVLLLGLPWSLIPSFFEFGGAEGAVLYALVLLPLLVNAIVFYLLGKFFGRLFSATTN